MPRDAAWSVRTLVLAGDRWHIPGPHAAPEGAATFAALAPLVASGFLGGDERVVLFNTGTGLKYPPPV